MPSRILVPVDGRPASDRALDEAIRLAAGTGAALVIVAVSPGTVGATDLAATPASRDSSVPAPAAVTELAECAAARARAAGIRCEEGVVDSAGHCLARTLLDGAAAWRCDLVVMGVRGRCALTRVALGHEAESVLRSARIPVMLVHAPTMDRARRTRRRRLRGPDAMPPRLPEWLEPRAAA